MRSARSVLNEPRVFDGLVAGLMAALVLGAYITAYAYVIEPNRIEPVANIGYGIVLAAWLGATALLFASFGIGLRAGRPWDRALPDGYTGSLAAALIFGAAWIVDNGYWQNDFVGTTTVGLIQPGSNYYTRFNQVDLRLGKIIRIARTRSNLSLDIYNVLNSDVLSGISATYATWLAPTGVVQFVAQPLAGRAQMALLTRHAQAGISNRDCRLQARQAYYAKSVQAASTE